MKISHANKFPGCQTNSLKLITYLIIGLPIITQAESFNNEIVAGLGIGAGTFMTRGAVSTSSPLETSNAIIVHTINNLANGHYNISQYSVMGSLFLGLNQFYKQKYYLGEEFSLNITNAYQVHAREQSRVGDNFFTFINDFTPIILEDNVITKNIIVKQNQLIPAFDIKPGIRINDTSFTFLRFGIAYNQLKLINNTDIYFNSILLESSELSFSKAQNLKTIKNKNVVGVRGGLGVEVEYLKNLSLAVNYVYSYYGRINYSKETDSTFQCDIVEGCLPRINKINTSSEAIVSNQDILLELIYHFA